MLGLGEQVTYSYLWNSEVPVQRVTNQSPVAGLFGLTRLTGHVLTRGHDSRNAGSSQ
jgi:hypothetical protein